MLPEVIRCMIDEYGRWTLIKASELAVDGVDPSAIAGDLGIADHAIEHVITVGSAIRRIAAEQANFERAIIEPC